MPTLFAFLASAAGPLAIKVLLALGIGTVTFTGVTEALTALITQMQTNWGGVSGAVLQLASLAGIPEGFGIIAGALTARVALWVAVSATKWVMSAPS